MAPSTGTLFTGHDLTCIRGERTVFAGLDFALDAGGALLLVGPNGSGKSSLLRLMAGLGRAAAGVLAWGAEPIGDEPEIHHARLHYVGHQDAVKPVLTVAENLAFWTALRAADRDTRGAVRRALETFGSAHLANVPGRFLSAGQRRRINLARLVATPAPLWLLDEPTTALDRDATAALEDAVSRHRAGGGLVAIATHADLAVEGAEVLELDRFAVRPGTVPEAA